MAVAVRALEGRRCLSQFTSSGTAVGSWRRYAYEGLVPVPYSTSVGSNVTGEHVERLEKSQSPLWMSSPMIQSALAGTPFDGVKCVVGGLEGAIPMEPATWGIRGSHRARPQVRRPNMASSTILIEKLIGNSFGSVNLQRGFYFVGSHVEKPIQWCRKNACLPIYDCRCKIMRAEKL